MSLLSDTAIEELEETWMQFLHSLSLNNRATAEAYAKQHIAHIYITIRTLQNTPITDTEFLESLEKNLEKL